jgi:hypothetical protein
LTSLLIISNLQAGNLWTGADPQGSDTTDAYNYIFDLGDFFTSGGHPGGDQTGTITNNDYDLGFVLDSFAPESHKVNKLGRVTRAGGKLVGILQSTTTNINFDNVEVDIAPEKLIGHIQTRPDIHHWQCKLDWFSLFFLSPLKSVEFSHQSPLMLVLHVYDPSKDYYVTGGPGAQSFIGVSTT